MHLVGGVRVGAGCQMRKASSGVMVLSGRRAVERLVEFNSRGRKRGGNKMKSCRVRIDREQEVGTEKQ